MINSKFLKLKNIKDSLLKSLKNENVDKIKKLIKDNSVNDLELISFLKEIQDSVEEKDSFKIPDLNEMRKITENKKDEVYQEVRDEIKLVINKHIKSYSSNGDWKADIFYFSFSYKVLDFPNLDKLIDEILKEYREAGFVCERVDHERKMFRKIMIHWSKDKNFSWY